VALNASMRNSALTPLLNKNHLARLASRFTNAGPSSKSLRPRLPKVFAAGNEKTDVSNHWLPAPMPPTTFGVPLASGRCVFPGARRLAACAVEVVGRPRGALQVRAAFP